jgi:hypothetical protein
MSNRETEYGKADYYLDGYKSTRESKAEALKAAIRLRMNEKPIDFTTTTLGWSCCRANRSSIQDDSAGLKSNRSRKYGSCFSTKANRG